jgi:hypothetical protein
MKAWARLGAIYMFVMLASISLHCGVIITDCDKAVGIAAARAEQ